MKKIFIIILCIITFPALAASLPNPVYTPGAINAAVTQNNIKETICKVGYTKLIRPDSYYTTNLKKYQLTHYYNDEANIPSEYEEDHLISLELGGSPSSPRNLWPEPYFTNSGWGARVKDKLENHLHKLVCANIISLNDAQKEISTNWIDAYKKYIGPNP